MNLSTVLRRRPILAFGIATLFAGIGAPRSAQADVRNWDGDSDAVWGNLNNWDTLPLDSIATDIAQFNLATYGFQPNAGAVSINGLIVGGASGAVTITSSAASGGLSIGASGIDMSAAAANLTLGTAGTQLFTIGAAQEWKVASGRTLTVAGKAQINSALTLSGPGEILFNTASSGTGAVTVGSGTVRLTTTSSTLGTGSLTINGGSIGTSTGGADFTLGNSAYTFAGDFSILGAGSGKNYRFNAGAITLGGGVGVTRTVTVSGSGIAIFANAVSDGGNGNGLTKAGGLGLVLVGANTYTGNTTVNAGVLHIGGSVGAGSVNGQTSTGSLSPSSAIVLTAGTLQFNRSNNVTQGTDFSGASITGAAGGVTQAGAANTTLTLNAANTYGGATRVNSGILSVVGSGSLGASNNLTVSAGARFNYLPTTVGTTLTLGTASTLSFAAGSTIGLEWNATTVNKIKALGTATIGVGTGVTLAITGSYSSGTSYTVLEAASGLGTGVYNVLNPTDFTLAVNKTATSVTVIPTVATPLANAYWKGGFVASAKLWTISDGSSTSNWASDVSGTSTSLTPGAGTTVNFSATGALAANKTGITLGADASVAGVVVSDADPIGLSADPFTLTLGTGGIAVNSGSGAVTLGALLSLGGAQSWTNNSANLLTVSGNVTNGGNLLTVTGTGNTTISSVIGGGAGGLAKSGSGTLSLSGANTYTGATSVSAGTLSISNAGAFTNSSAFNLSGTGRLDVNVANQSLAKLALPTGSGVAAGTFLRLSQNQATAGAGNGPGTIAGTLELNLATIAANYVLSLGAGSTVRPLINSNFTPTSTDLLGNSTFDFGTTTTSTIANGISTSTSGAKVLTVTGTANSGNISGAITDGSGSLSIEKTGSGKVNLTNIAGTSLFTGGLTIKAGTVAVEADVNSLAAKSAAGSGTITLGDSGGSLDAALGFWSGAKFITNAITVANGSTGNTLALQSNLTTGSTFSGAITMNHDLVLQNLSTGTSVISTGGISNNGYKITVNNSSSGQWTISSAMTGSGAFEQNSSGSGQVTLSGTNTAYTGAITITAGTLSATVANALGAATGVPALTNNGTLTLGGGAAGIDYGGGQINLNNGSTLNYNQNTGSGSTITKKITVAAAATTAINFNSGTTNRTVGFAQSGLEIGAGATVNQGLTSTSQNGVYGAAEGVVTLLGSATVNVINSNASPGTVPSLIIYGRGIADSSGTASFTKAGSGILILGATTTTPVVTGAASTYGGTTTVNAGTLRIGIADSIPDSALAVNTGATFDMSANGNGMTAGTFAQRVAGLNDGIGGGGTIVGNSINTANSGNIQNRTLTLDGASGAFTFSGVIMNKPVANATANSVLSVAKSGGSTQTLSGVNTYTGATTITAGTLLVSGSIANSTVNVSGTGVLGGSGGTTGAVNVTTGGTLAPGASIGTLNTGAVSLGDSSIFSAEIGATTADQVNITGAATLAGTVNLALTLTADPVEDTIFTLLNGTSTLVGYSGGARFSYAGNSLDEGEIFTATTGAFSQSFQISYAADSGNDVSITAVPEPGAVCSLLGGMGLLLGATRLRRRS